MKNKLCYVGCSLLLCLLCKPATALDSGGQQMGVEHSSPLRSFVIEAQETRYLQYNMSPNAWVSPYVGLGNDEVDVEAIGEGFVHEHSYQSLEREDRNDKRWAGLKLRLSQVFNLNIDARQRNIRSTFAVSPDTKMRLRVRPRRVKADFIYRF